MCPQAGEPLLVAERVSKSFGDVRAVRDVSIEVGTAEIVGVVGPNGSGKTTFFHCVTGFEHPDTGRIEFRGADVTGWAAHRLARRGLARSFQHTMLFEGRTVRDSVMSAMRCRGASEESESGDSLLPDEVLDFCGLTSVANTVVDDLAHGVKRLIGVAMAVAVRPALIMLDEPGAGLHPTEHRQLRDLVVALRDRGVSTLIIDHNMPFLLPICDRIVVLDAGQKIAEGRPQEIRRDPRVIDVYLGSAGGGVLGAEGSGA